MATNGVTKLKTVSTTSYRLRSNKNEDKLRMMDGSLIESRSASLPSRSSRKRMEDRGNRERQFRRETGVKQRNIDIHNPNDNSDRWSHSESNELSFKKRASLSSMETLDSNQRPNLRGRISDFLDEKEVVGRIDEDRHASNDSDRSSLSESNESSFNKRASSASLESLDSNHRPNMRWRISEYTDYVDEGEGRIDKEKEEITHDRGKLRDYEDKDAEVDGHNSEPLAGQHDGSRESYADVATQDGDYDASSGRPGGESRQRSDSGEQSAQNSYPEEEIPLSTSEVELSQEGQAEEHFSNPGARRFSTNDVMEDETKPDSVESRSDHFTLGQHDEEQEDHSTEEDEYSGRQESQTTNLHPTDWSGFDNDETLTSEEDGRKLAAVDMSNNVENNQENLEATNLLPNETLMPFSKESFQQAMQSTEQRRQQFAGEGFSLSQPVKIATDVSFSQQNAILSDPVELVQQVSPVEATDHSHEPNQQVIIIKNSAEDIAAAAAAVSASLAVIIHI